MLIYCAINSWGNGAIPRERNLVTSTRSTIVLPFTQYSDEFLTDIPAHIQNDLYIGLFNESLFIRTKDWKLLKFSSLGAGWLNYSISTEWNTMWLFKKENFYVLIYKDFWNMFVSEKIKIQNSIDSILFYFLKKGWSDV